jgi:hypothetical protein
MSCFSDITEQYLDKLYDDLSKEQMKLMGDLKNTRDCAALGEAQKEADLQKQLSLLNILMINALRFRNLKKKIAQKANSC